MANIDLQNVSVTYFLRRGSKATGAPNSAGGEIIRKGRRTEVLALRDISISMRDGDRIGLIGTNGSGKSTLLRLCSGALSAQSGQVRIDGSVSAQFSLGAGIKPALSGRLNAELRCLYMGVAQSMIRRRVNEVRELSGLGDFFELPVSSYSAGMRSRLVLSLMHLMTPEILLVDEWIGATDAASGALADNLQQKTISLARLLLIASHSKEVLHQWTTSVVWLHAGRLRRFGPTAEVLAEYEANFAEASQARHS